MLSDVTVLPHDASLLTPVVAHRYGGGALGQSTYRSVLVFGAILKDLMRHSMIILPIGILKLIVSCLHCRSCTYVRNMLALDDLTQVTFSTKTREFAHCTTIYVLDG